jgi:hypothetical protein
MHRLAGSIVQLIVAEHGPREMLDRLADPYWFQAFGCVLGFDWHSSGLTTVTCGAVGEAYRCLGDDLGIHVAGGKGGASRKTPEHHPVYASDINPHRLSKILRTIHEHTPADFESLLGLEGVGPKSIRSLALISELVYGTPTCRDDITRRWTPQDPPTFSHAHGGKDGHPFPVDRPTYDRSIHILEDAVRRARIDPAGKDQALYRLSEWLV